MTFPRLIYRNGVNPERPDDLATLREIAPSLFIGDFSAAHDPGHTWHRVIDLWGQDPKIPTTLRICEPFHDGDQFPAGVLDRVHAFLLGQLHAGPCLIHCQAGLSRSASAAVALMVLSGIPSERAIARVRIPELGAFGARYPRALTLDSALGWARAAHLRGLHFTFPGRAR